MHSILIQMSLLMASGIVWRIVEPEGLDAEQTRKVLTTVVYYFFLPAMVLEVLWTADIGLHSLQYTALAVVSILFGMLCLWTVGSLFKVEHRCLGAMILAAAFPNITYLGLPVLEQTFGSWARSVVIQIDLFAASPLLFTLGVVVVRHYGKDTSGIRQPVWSFLNAPPFWAAGIAVLLNLNGLAAPIWLIGTLKLLSGAVVPLMLFSLGLALSWKAVRVRNIPYIIPVVVIKMILMPLFAIVLVDHTAMANNYKAAAVLDLAMPSMVLGIVLCDRYQLDSSLYAMAVTVTTALSLITLPFWYQVLMARF
ncbi:AEC family transporter [Methyloglobulus sp.]|uniref:AEC family transporter n=1 Tax=Methyloglobulus sp. TaxID=2518622 RepID=UPI003989F29A